MSLRIRTPLLYLPPSNALWVNTSNIWRQAILWVNILGVWKQTTLWINVNATWK